MKLITTVVLTGLLLVTARTAARGTDIEPSRGGETPVIRTVEPTTGHAGSRHMAIGDYLGSRWVRELFLTNGKEDIKVGIIRQSDITIEFRIPSVKPDRYALMVLTSGANPILIEQAVYVVVVGQ